MKAGRVAGCSRLAAGLLVAGLLSACAPAYRGVPLYGPLDTSDPQVALGQRVFDAHCDQCHPGGAGGLGPSLNSRPLPGFVIEFQVRHGLGAMPSFSEEQISDEELDAVVAYLDQLRSRTMQEAGP
ncbi:MAG TPA: cytochrome c [Trueperaceae bacterium]